MKHKVSKIKVKQGSDANGMLMRKLVRNFAEHGYLTTTMTKGSYLKSLVQILAGRAASYSEASKNVLLPYFGTLPKVKQFVETVQKQIEGVSAAGIVRMVKLGPRTGDAAPMVKVMWTREVDITKNTKSTKPEPKPKAK